MAKWWQTDAGLSPALPDGHPHSKHFAAAAECMRTLHSSADSDHEVILSPSLLATQYSQPQKIATPVFSGFVSGGG